MSAERPDWRQTLLGAQFIEWLGRDFQTTWTECINRSFPDDAPLYNFSPALKAALMSATRANLLSRSAEYAEDSGLQTHFVEGMKQPVLWANNASWGGPQFHAPSGPVEPVSNDGSSAGSANPAPDTLGVMSMSVTVRGLLPYHEVLADRPRHGGTLLTHQLENVSMLVEIHPPSRSYKAAVKLGVVTALRTYAGVLEETSRQFEELRIRRRAIEQLNSYQEDFERRWGIADRHPSESAAWHEVECTIEPTASRGLYFRATFAGMYWHKTEEHELSQQAAEFIVAR